MEEGGIPPAREIRRRNGKKVIDRLSKVNVGTVPSTVRGSRGNDPKKYLGKEGRRAFTLEKLV